MTRRIVEMRNLGPKTASWLAEAGIETEAELRAVGSVNAYRRLRHQSDRHVSLNALYAMEAALRGVDWRDLDVELKKRLRRELLG